MEALTTLPAFPRDGSVQTLGLGVIRWMHAHLLQPDGPEAGEPFRLTREMRQFVLWWYAVDAKGRFIYRRAVLRRPKGWGKSPFMAALCLAELCGPTVFAGWNPDGSPMAMRHPMPHVIVAGVSEAQTENTLSAVRAMCEESDLVDDLGLDVGLTRILLPGGGKFMPITASSSTQEGARPTFCVMDETHHWTKTNGGHALAKVIKRNLAKIRGGMARVVETTNAHEPNQDSVAEKSFLGYLAIRDGRSAGTGILYDCREAPGGVDLADEAQLRLALICAYGDSTWVDHNRLVEEIYDPDASDEESLRFYLNQIVAAANSWLKPADYDMNADPTVAPLTDGDTCTLGFDGALTDDSTALVAVRVTDGAPFLLGIWEKPEGPQGDGWHVDKSRARQAVAWAFGNLDIVGFFADVAYWETDVDMWRDEYGEKLLVKASTHHAVAYDMRSHQKETVMAVEALHRAFTDGMVPHLPHQVQEQPGLDGAAILRRHVLNARRRLNRYGVSFGKESRESPKKVDALAALILARMARTKVLADGSWATRTPATGQLYGF
jgi:hypothetical protein